MKKTIIASLVLMMFAGSSKASISVVFDTASGGVANVDGTALADLFTGNGYVQLIWSTVNAYSGAGVGGTVDANYFVLYSGAFTGPLFNGDIDGTTVYQNTSVGGNNINAGFIYGRVFSTDPIIQGTRFADSLIYSTSTFADFNAGGPPPTPNSVDMISGDGTVLATDGEGALLLPFTGIVVPEPSVLAFLGLGGLALAARRRFIA